MVNVQSLVHSGAWRWGKRTQSHCCCHLLRGTGCGISHLLCLQSGKVWHLPFIFERDWLCLIALMMVARLPKTLILLNLSLDCIMFLQPEQHQCRWLINRPGFLCCCPVLGCRISLYGWPAQRLVVVFVAAPTCLSLWRTPAGSAWRAHSYSAADPAARGGGPAGRSSQ